MVKPQVHSQFIVSSGCLCFGALHNIWHGSTQEVQAFPSSLESPNGGTVSIQILQHNTVAKNGAWLVYQLIDQHTQRVCGWFVCHIDIEPETEVARILTISGSPYEDDSGSSKNDESTFAGAVLVINRYDWSYYDERCADKVTEPNQNGETFDQYEALGLVDQKSAQQYVNEWRQEGSGERNTLENGTWMHVPGGEYMFGRFGFDAQRTAAQSFLFFTVNTDFTRTFLNGVDRALRQLPIKDDGDNEISQSRLMLGNIDDSEGLLRLKQELDLWSVVPPDEGELLGYYNEAAYIVPIEDLDAIRSHRTQYPFHARWTESIHICLNEMILGYVEHFIVPRQYQDSVLAVAASLFPDHEKPRSLDSLMYKAMADPEQEITQEVGISSIGRKLRDFLAIRGLDNNLLQKNEFVHGLVAVIHFLLSEILELSGQLSRDSSRQYIFPLDIRISTLRDGELLKAFQYSRCYWKGRKDSLALPA